MNEQGPPFYDMMDNPNKSDWFDYQPYNPFMHWKYQADIGASSADAPPESAVSDDGLVDRIVSTDEEKREIIEVVFYLSDIRKMEVWHYRKEDGEDSDQATIVSCVENGYTIFQAVYERSGGLSSIQVNNADKNGDFPALDAHVSVKLFKVPGKQEMFSIGYKLLKLDPPYMPLLTRFSDSENEEVGFTHVRGGEIVFTWRHLGFIDVHVSAYDRLLKSLRVPINIGEVKKGLLSHRVNDISFPKDLFQFYTFPPDIQDWTE